MSVSIQVNERLAALTEAGVSVWLDQIRRSLTEGGELERMVREDCLRGVTSNPAIFEKEIFEEIAIKDVQLAADVLHGVWEEQGHADGFVSLEVSPHLAHDTGGTIE